MTESNWTSSESLLDEGKQLLKLYDLAETQEVKDQINGCFVAIQETLLAKREVKIE